MAIPPEMYGEDDSPPSRAHIPDKKLKELTDDQLADYIESGTYEQDGTSSSIRHAIVRLLRSCW
jgi:hypothetical protein